MDIFGGLRGDGGETRISCQSDLQQQLFVSLMLSKYTKMMALQKVELQGIVAVPPFQVVTRRYTRPFRYSTISDPRSFELPYTLSTKVMGTYEQA